MSPTTEEWRKAKTRREREFLHEVSETAGREAALAPLLAEAPELPDPYTEYTRDGKVLLHACRTHIDPKTPMGRRIARGYARFFGLADDSAPDAGMPIFRDFDEEFRLDRIEEAGRARGRALVKARPLTPGEIERVAGLLAPQLAAAKKSEATA